MLSRAFEWYRVVNAQPSSEVLDRRITAVNAMTKSLDATEDWNTLFDLAQGVVAGYETRYRTDSPIIISLVEAVRGSESAFPQELGENALELRALSAIVLGELMNRNSPEHDQQATLIAWCVRSGLALRPAARARYLNQLLTELGQLATDVISNAARARRRRGNPQLQRFEKLTEPADIAGVWKTVSAMRSSLREMQAQSLMDREELNLAWWLLARHSTRAGKPLAELPGGAAAFCCAAEVAELVLMPPALAGEGVVRRALSESLRDDRQGTLEAVAADLTAAGLSASPVDSSARSLWETYPALFPVTWKLDANDSAAAKSAKAYEEATGLKAPAARRLSTWAVQMFDETVLHRLYAASIRD